VQAEPHGTPEAHLDSEGEGKERSNHTDRCEASLKEALNSALKSALSVGVERHNAQPLFEDQGKKGNEDNENERIDKEEEGGEGREKQREQVEEEEGASSVHRAEGSDDGEREALETPYVELEPTQNEERLEEGAQGYGASDGARLASGVNNAHDVPLTEEQLVNVQGTASPSKTSAVPVSPSDVVSTPRRELEHRTDAEQVIPNDLVANRANVTKKQAEHACLTTQHEGDIERTQSRYSDVVYDEDEIVVSNGERRDPRSNGGIIDPRTKDTLGTGGHTQDLMDADDSSSDVDGTAPAPKATRQTMSDPEPRGLLPRTRVYQRLPESQENVNSPHRPNDL
jgi:hypothetical protein